MNIEVIGISRDLGPSQNKFKEQVGAKNIFYSDLDGKITKAYGALNEQNNLAKRFYFLIGENGNIVWKNVTGQLIPVEKLVEDLHMAVKVR